MPCACRDKKSLTPNSMNLRRTNPRPDETGTIMLQSAPDCVEQYSGPFRKTTVFVVGYGTEHEQIFKRADRTAAIAAARATSSTFDQVIAGQLCADAVEALLA
jgi:uncharacterized Rossmann fold enzyme